MCVSSATTRSRTSSCSRRCRSGLTRIAQRADMPLGEPLRFDEAQYEHQIPGGVISNLRFQLEEIGLTHRFDEVLAEAVRVREDLGYPIMITPYSQYVATQAAINVATGERYKVVIDELIRFAQGIFGEDSGYTWMDQNLKDRFLSLPRAAELGSGGGPSTQRHVPGRRQGALRHRADAR